MRIVASSLREVGGEVPSGVGHARLAIAKRAGLRLVLTADDGRTGVGEGAPLPGYSPDDLASARASLERVHERIGPIDDRTLAGVRRSVAEAGLRFSAAFAVETALVDLVARSVGVSAHTFLGAKTSAPITRSGLVSRLDGPGADDLRALVDRGFSALKIKIGRPDRIDDELAFVREARRVIGPAAALTVDANGAIDLVDARLAIAGAAYAGATLIEQPIAGAAIVDLGVQDLPWAVDEALVEDGVGERAIGAPGCGALVLKPALLGLFRAHDLAVRARARGLDVIVSHLFDGPIGMASACELALAIGSLPAGLDVHPALSAFGDETVPQLRTDAWITPSEHPGLGFDDR